MNLTAEETVRTYYDSLGLGRRQVLMEVLDPEVVLELQEGFPETRSKYVGIKAYLEDFLYSLYGCFELQFFPEEFLESGERVVVLGRHKGKAVRTGVPVDAPFVHLWTVRDGHLVHGRMFTDTAILREAMAGHPAPLHSP
ncbi:MAG: nuclear transport factor 2 family protein [Planctomycetaceae bacterium]|nr:nuclear transport factor 2 family protein [Planctomycetaceae bacterium]